MKALICGAGIAGVTLAWWLERSGWEVELVERAGAFRDGGYMIDFMGPGYEVAQRMGLGPRLLEVAYPLAGLSYVDRDGRQTSGIDGGGFRTLFAQVVNLLRGDLARVIHDQVQAPVRYGTSIERIDQTSAGVTVKLTDGTERDADLLVGADGAHSRVRELAFGPEEDFVRHLGHHTAAYIVPDEPLARRVGSQYRIFNAPGRMVGAYALREGRIAVMFLHREDDPAVPADPVSALRRRYGDFGWIVPRALEICPQPPLLYYDQVTQVEMERWSRGRVVLLGDACQAVSLFAGYGASMAMAAAYVLAGELGASGPDPIGALDRYHRRMRPVIADTQRFGRRFIKWMAPDTAWRIAARDWMVRLAALPGADRLLRRSVTPGNRDLITAPRKPEARAS